MLDKKYIEQIEAENESLRKKLFCYDTLRDIITSRVNVVSQDVFKLLDPMRVCAYMEALGWTLNYEKRHERYLTRSYLSPHKDTKCKVFVKDFTHESNHKNGGILTKLSDVICVLARLHKKGELEVIYEIITNDIKTTKEL